MIIFKESTHSLLDSGENAILTFLGSFGATRVASKTLQDIYQGLPEKIKDKIRKKTPLNYLEEKQEMEVLKEETGNSIKFRTPSEGRLALQELNEYYRQNNPLGQSKYNNNNRFDDDSLEQMP